MQVNDCEVRFQLDSGADVNTICQKSEEISSEIHLTEIDYA